MVFRRCPQCGSTSDDQYGFCIKCGWEFAKIDATKNLCPLCGHENPNEADFCVKCGAPLVFKNHPNEEQRNITPIVINKEVAGTPIQKNSGGWIKWIIILGYIFSILGGLLGLIIAIYLVTRKEATVRKHGIIQLAIFAFYIVLIAALYATGMIPADAITNYQQLIAGNMTLP